MKHNYGWIGVTFSDKMTDSIDVWLDRVVDKNDILTPSSTDMNAHITLKYGIHTNDIEKVKKAISSYNKGYVYVKLGKTSIFKHEDQDVVKVEVLGRDLHRINALLSENLKTTDTFPVFKPHLTIAYLKPGTGRKYTGRQDFVGKDYKLYGMHFKSAKGQQHCIPFLSTEEQVKRAFLKEAGFYAGLVAADPLTFMIKVAVEADSEYSFWQNVKTYGTKHWPIMAATAATTAATAIGAVLLERSADEISKDPRYKVRNTDAIIGRAKDKAGLSVIPHTTFKKINNMAYIPSGSIATPERERINAIASVNLLSSNETVKETGEVLKKIVEYSVMPSGGIIVGEKFENPYTIAHELGHAQIAKDGGIYNFLQNNAKNIQQLGLAASAASIVPHLMGSGIFGNKTQDSGMFDKISLGLFGIGLGLSVVGAASELATEAKASDIARNIMSHSRIHAETKALGEKMLDRSWQTYLVKGLGATAPSVAAATAKLLLSWK